MTCEVCGIGQREAKQIRYNLSIEDRVVLVDHVPAEVCDHCGEVTLSSDVVKRLQQTIWSDEKPVRTLEARVYEFA